MQERSRVLSVAIEAGLPVYLRGAPGIGKTALIREIGRGLGYHVETVIASLHDPTDFSGLPVKADGRAVFSPPEWAVRLYEAGRAILFLDELSTAAPAVQAAALRVVHERVVGYLELPEGVRVVAAGNEASDSEAVWDLTPPLANRFLHLTMKAEAEGVVDYFLGGPGVFSLAKPKEDWRERVPEKKALVASFLSVRPSLLHGYKPGEGSGPWPSPRTWEMTAVFLAAGDGVLSQDEILLGVSGLVGSGAALEFLHYLAELDLPKPEEVLRGKKKLPESPDKLMATLSGIVDYALSHQEYVERASELIGEAAEEHPDVAITVARVWVGKLRGAGLPMPKGILKLRPMLLEILGLGGGDETGKGQG